MIRFCFVLLLALWHGRLVPPLVVAFTGASTGAISTASFSLRKTTARRWAALSPDDESPKKASKLKKYRAADFTRSTFSKIFTKPMLLKAFQSALQEHIETRTKSKAVDPTGSEDSEELAFWAQLLQDVDAQIEVLRKVKQEAKNERKFWRDFLLDTDNTVALPDNASVLDLTYQVWDIGDDLTRLKLFNRKVFDHYLPSQEEAESFAHLEQLVNTKISKLQPRSKRNTYKGENRIVPIDYKLDTKMEFRHDFDNFEKRIDNMFGWFGKGQNIFLAPYFAMVQSSGMGKTRLLTEYRQNHRDNTLMVLCSPDKLPSGSSLEQFFDDSLITPKETIGDDDAERIRVRKQLNELVRQISGKRVVLLFDEAQHLLDAEDFFYFRVVQLWLRENTSNKDVVAVFTGTSTRLASFFKEAPEDTNFSRDIPTNYNKGTQLYEPFYQLHTMGLDKYQAPPEHECVSDFDRAAYFGRPLFARLAAEKCLDDTMLEKIRRRMIMDKRISTLVISDASILGVLGTRVQMGCTSFQLASDLVATGYACLTGASSTNPDFTHVAYLPDPVPAYLAMTLMMPYRIIDEIIGLKPKSWTSHAKRLFSSSLCLPVEGGIGEIAAALYLLFCGDVLRMSLDKTAKTFRVPLSRLLQLAAKPSASKLLTTPVALSSADTSMDAKSTTRMAGEPYVSFIQVCRNYLGHSLMELTSKKYLEEWFTAGVAFYAHPRCAEYDLIAPIRIDRGDETKYYPLLVSVKNRESFSEGKRNEEMSALVNLINSTVEKAGVALVLLTGSPSIPKYADKSEDVLKKFRNWKGEGILNITIAVPKNDCFGCWDFATQTSIANGKADEIYSSHFVAHQTIGTEPNYTQLLRSRGKGKPVLKKLLEEFTRLDFLFNEGKGNEV